MPNKVIDFLVVVVFNGIIALLMTFVFRILLEFLLGFTLGLTRKGAADFVTSFGGENIGYKVFYAIMFISLMMEDMEVPNIKTAFNKWRARRKG